MKRRLCRQTNQQTKDTGGLRSTFLPWYSIGLGLQYYFTGTAVRATKAIIGFRIDMDSESFVTMFVCISGRRTFPEVKAQCVRTGARLDVRCWVDTRSAAVVDVAEVIRFSQRTRRQRRTISVHVAWCQTRTVTDVRYNQ